MGKSFCSVFACLLVSAFTASAGNALAVTFTGTGSGGTIPDNNATGVTSTIVVAPDNDFAIQNLVVTISGLNHTWVGDLVVTLSKGSTSVDLFRRLGRTSATSGFGDNANLNGTYAFSDQFTGNFLAQATSSADTAFIIPGGNYFASTCPATITSANPCGSVASSLSALFAEGAVGNWTLRISDNAGGDLGSFTGWSLFLEGQAQEIPEPSGVLGTLLLAGVGGGLLGRRKKVRAVR